MIIQHATLDSPISGLTQGTQNILSVICAINISGTNFNQSSDVFSLTKFTCFINEWIMNNCNYHDFLHGYIFLFKFPQYISPVSTLLYGNSLKFSNTLYSKHAVLFPRLIYRYFVTFFSEYFDGVLES